MRSITLLTVLSLCLASSSLLAQEKATVDGIESASSTEKTSTDIPLVFELQRVSTSGGHGGFQVWGKVTNPGDDTYEGIGLIITVYSSKRKLLGR